tara:strand:+ start:4165 stop:4404 length:240 start_codon:yes stop_codon:yes gene_type:complete
MRRRTKHKKGDQVEEQKQGKPWKKKGLFSSFEEADTKRNQLIVELGLEKQTSKGQNFQVKVKRCGDGGKQFMVKLRYLP